MATRRFDENREQSMAAISAGNAGNGNDDHLPMGRSSFNSTVTFQGLVRFAHDWSGMVTVTKVELLTRMSGGTHTEQGSSSKQMRISKAQQSWTSGGGSENSWSTSASGARYGEVDPYGSPQDRTMPDSGWVTTDITSLYDDLIPASLGGGGGTNNGLLLRAANATNAGESFEMYGMRSAYPPYLIVTYTTTPPNSAPNKPVITSPVNGQVFPPGTTHIPVSFTGSDPDAGDTMSKWGYTWGVGPTIGTVTDLSTADGFNVTDHPLGVAGAANVGGSDTLTVKTYDQDGAVSAVSAAVTIVLSNGPTVGSPTPPGGALADIHNAAELALWTLAGTHAKPIVKWTYQHSASRAMAKYRVRMYSDALAVLWDSGEVVASATPGQVVTVNVPTAIKGDGTPYRWGVEVQDIDGFWSPAMTPTTFKVRWGQAIYAENITTAGRDFSWNNTTPALGKVQFLYQLADDAAGTGATAWTTALPTQLPAGSEKAYLRVLVRLWATVAGQNPALPDMTLTYGKGTALLPDKWVNASPASAAISLDSSVKRFSRYSLRVRALTTASHFLYPYRATPGDGIAVVPDTDYTYSAYVKTNGPLAGGAIVKIGIRDKAGVTYIATLTPCDPKGAIQTNDTSAYPDGWQRLAGWFRVPPGTTLIQPDIWSNGLVVGNEYWVDGVKLEEGRVASTWTPGFVGPAAVHDRVGLQIDAKEGGIFRLRGTSGGVRDLVELGPGGLVIGGDTDLTAPSVGVLAVNGAPLAKASVPTVVLPPTGNFAKPAGCTVMVVELVGGGGAGGGTNTTAAGESAAGGGGGGGGYSKKTYTGAALAALPALIPVVIGAGAVSTNAATAPSGGATTFNGATQTAGGGLGGARGASGAGTITAAGGDGGIGTGGDINSPGAVGGTGRTISGTVAFTGDGGVSILGAGGRTTTVPAQCAGRQYGGGGGGLVQGAGNATAAGGDGAVGVCIVTWW